MLTDASPRKANRAGFLESDRIKLLDLPNDGRLLSITAAIESAMKTEASADVRRACIEFLDASSKFYKIPACGLRVLAARPLRVRESWSTELFGDYTPQTMLIRVWMRTAVRKELCGHKAAYDCIKAFSETDFTEDLKKFDVPTFILHGDDDQIVCPLGLRR